MNHQPHQPPAWAIRFFRWYCNDHLSDAVLGDMLELHERRTKKIGKRKADMLFVWNVFSFLQPFAVRRKRTHLNQFVMLENYFKVAWRSMTRQKMFAGIKIGGLAVGIATCLLIALFIQQELSYDRHYQNTGRIFRVYQESKLNGKHSKGIHFPAPMAHALKEDFPEIEKAGHYNAGEYFGAGSNELRRADQLESVHEEGFIFADQSLLDILQVQFIEGNPQNALADPHTIVITKTKAAQYFRDGNALGQILILNNDESRQYKVTGVITDFPVTSHLRVDFLMTMAGQEFWKGEQTDWGASNYLDYVELREDADPKILEEKLQRVVAKYFMPSAIANGDATAIDWTRNLKLKLQPITDIYLNTYKVVDGPFDGLEHGDVKYLWLFGAIGFFILLIAGINFINLSTARSANRAKEVGLRKVAGSNQGQLVRQFLVESILVSVISFALGVTLARLGLPYFNSLLNKSISFPWQAWWLVPVLALAAIVVGIVAGMYPAFYLAAFKPIRVLKGNLSMGSRSSVARSTLVSFQFCISIILIVSTLVVNKQMRFMLEKKLGFDKERVVILQDTHTMGDKASTFKNELIRLPGVQSASVTTFLPISGLRRNGNPFWLDGRKGIDEGVQAQSWSVDEDYLATMGIKLLSGRNFSFPIADDHSMIINRSMAKALNLKDPLGAVIADPWNNKSTVIGVIDDFHFESMRSSIAPLSLVLKQSSNNILVKLQPGNMPKTIELITALWKQFLPNQSMRYAFFDERYARTYDDVKRMEGAFASFSALAVLVACLGLFALSVFMIEQRGKEIGVRIVLGATTQNIVRLLTKNFLGLVLIAYLIAVPLSWYLMHRWLEDYVYKIYLSWDIFAVAGLMALLIATLTVSYQSIRAAWINPAQTLRLD